MKKTNNAELAARLEPLCLKTASKLFVAAHAEIAKRAARAIVQMNQNVTSTIIRMCVSYAGMQLGVEMIPRNLLTTPAEILDAVVKRVNFAYKNIDVDTKNDIVQNAIVFGYEYSKTEEFTKAFINICVQFAGKEAGILDSYYFKKITAKAKNGEATEREKKWLEDVKLSKNVVYLDDDSDDTVFQLHSTTPAPDSFIEFEAIEIAKKMLNKIIEEDTEDDNLAAVKEVIELMQVGETLEAAAKAVGKSAQLIHYHLRKLGKMVIELHGREALFA